MRLARSLLEKGSKYIVISQVFPKNKGDELKNRVDECNLRLIARCSNEERLVFWAHPRINDRSKHYRDDGTHLNDEGNYLFFRSIRNAILHIRKHNKNGEPCLCRTTYHCRTDGWRRRRGKRERW